MLTDKLLTMVCGLLFLLIIACNETTETQSTSASPALRVKEMSRTAAFVDYAASTNMLQIELGKLAMEKGQEEQVKALGEQMRLFYGDAQAQLRDVARAEGLHNSLPDSLGAADRGIVAEFKKLPAAEFDARYQQYVHSSYKSQLDRYQEMLLRADEEEIRNWVNEMQLQLRARTQPVAQHNLTERQ